MRRARFFMVLELLIKPHAAERVPLAVGIAAFVYTFLAIIVSYKLFPEQSSVLSVAFITILFVPLFQRLFSIEEKKDTKRKGNLLARHSPLIYVFAAFFIGTMLATSAAFIIFPEKDIVFGAQRNTLDRLGSVTGAAFTQGDFSLFFVNNTQVMILVFVFSAVFGAAAIFILVWNASVIGVYTGAIVESISRGGVPLGTAYVYGVPYSLATIALHGIPEILAYFFAAVAGGVLGIGIIREKWSSKAFHEVLKDGLAFLVIAEVLIIGAAFLEAIF